MSVITRLRAWEILDSRGKPTLAVEATLQDGTRACAQVPSGASTGRWEAHELRDGDASWYQGNGVRRAAALVEGEIARAVAGMEASAQKEVDEAMIQLDGTPDKSRLGANAILGVSCAVARAAARSRGLPLWQHLAESRAAVIPLPMVNILSGGRHAIANFEFQDFLAIPHGFPSYREALHAAGEIHREAFGVLEEKGCVLTGVADEGGWGPRLESNEAALEVMMKAIERAGYQPGEQVSIAIDVAATQFYRNGRYRLAGEARALRGEEMVALLEGWCARYPVLSIEDGVSEDDWEGMRELTRRLGSRVQILGDDFFATNLGRLERGIAEGAGNAVLVKMNQTGTLTETFRVIDRAAAAGYRAVISARSGETEDAFLADLAMASGAGQIKVGSVVRSERLAKYNRLLEWEDRLKYAGDAALKRFLTSGG